MKKVKNYLKPVCSVETLQTAHLLGVVSGQHQPIGQGGSAGDAKSAFIFEEEEEDDDDKEFVNNEGEINFKPWKY